MTTTGLAEFDRDAALDRRDGTTFHASAPPGWCGATGRPQGGFLAAQMLLGMTSVVGDPTRTVRAVTAHFLRAPTPESYRVECTVERTGRTITNVTSRLVQEGRTMALAMAMFATSRDGPEIDELPMPDVAPPSPGRGMQAEVPAFALPFADRVVVQQREGPVPFTASQGPMDLGGWLGFADPRPVDPVGLLVLCDAVIMPWWVRLDDPVPTATVDYTIHFRGDPPAGDPHDLGYGRFTTRLVRGGFLDWDGVVWGPDGTVLCLARQQLVTLA